MAANLEISTPLLDIGTLNRVVSTNGTVARESAIQTNLESLGLLLFIDEAIVTPSGANPGLVVAIVGRSGLIAPDHVMEEFQIDPLGIGVIEVHPAKADPCLPKFWKLRMRFTDLVVDRYLVKGLGLV